MFCLHSIAADHITCLSPISSHQLGTVLQDTSLHDGFDLPRVMAIV